MGARAMSDRKIRNWIVVAGSIVNTTNGGGYEFFGPYSQRQAERLRSSLEAPDREAIAVELLYHPSEGEP
jgi:hypothetical protein